MLIAGSLRSGVPTAAGECRHDGPRRPTRRTDGRGHPRAARCPRHPARRRRRPDRRGGRRRRRPAAAVRAAGRPRHLRPRGALREVSRRDPARPAGRPRVPVDADGLRRPAGPARRAGGRGEPERRIARPRRLGGGRPVLWRADRRRDQQPGLGARRRRGVARRRARRARAGGRGHQDLHRGTARALPARGVGATRVGRRRRRRSSGTALARRTVDLRGPPTGSRSWSRATGSPSGWSPPRAATPTRPRARPR